MGDVLQNGEPGVRGELRTRSDIRRAVTAVNRYPMDASTREAVVRILKEGAFDESIRMCTRIAACKALASLDALNMEDESRDYEARCADAGLSNEGSSGPSVAVSHVVIQQIAGDADYQEYCRQRAIASVAGPVDRAAHV